MNLHTEFGFYSNCNRKPLKDFKEGNNMDMIYTFKRTLDKKVEMARHSTPIIPVTWKAETERSQVGGRVLSQKNK